MANANGPPAHGGESRTDLLAMFLARVADDPEHQAVMDDERDLDYATLHREVAALAAGLSARGVQPGDRIALQLPNSADFLIAALAALWVGAIFVPLAVADPPLRLAHVVDDCSPTLVLTSPAVTDAHPSAVRIGDVARPDLDPPEPSIDPALAGYAIYTSGTTGTPKGVVIGRRALAAALRCTIDNLELDTNTRTLCVSPFHFDGSFATLFPTIASGGAVVIPRRDALLFARFFFRIVAREQITYTGFSSSYLRLLLAAPELGTLSSTPLGIVALGGEACSGVDAALLQQAAPNLRIFNRYGPTETTIAVTHFEVTRDVQASAGTVPIGKPHVDVEFFLIGEGGTRVEGVGEVGELYIGGAQLMNGYWGAEKLSAEVLRTDVVPGQLVYRTGDLILRNAEGDYVYVDRVDRVVKRNAVRISLVELGDVIRNLPDVTAAVCATYDKEGQLGIAAFVVTEAQITPDQLRRAAAEQLPATMLPDAFHLVDVLPLTASSKLDERRLLAEAGLSRN